MGCYPTDGDLAHDFVEPGDAEAVTQVIRQIDGCASLPVIRSTPIENSRWKRAIE